MVLIRSLVIINFVLFFISYRVMQSLGIDPVRTAESVKNDSYDHHAAIYFLLQDKLQSSTMTSQNMPKTNKTASDSPAKKQMSAGM